MSDKTRVAVIGTGIIGLHTAWELRQRHCHVTVYHLGNLWTTCSAKSAASFKPHEVFYDDRVHTMLHTGWDVYTHMAHGPASGVRLHEHWEAFSAPKPRPRYLEVMKNVQDVAFPHVPGGYAHGWKYQTFFIDMSIHLFWLKAMLQENGVRFVAVDPERFDALDDLLSLDEEAVFNCTGFGARELCQDWNVYPIKGQVALIDPIPDMPWSISADGFYLYPRQNDTVLGGTTEHHVYSEQHDPAVIQVLVRAHRRLLPTLSIADVREVKCGLRPYRKRGVRVEKEVRGGKTIIHNYGHGGSGVTLAPGSARMAVDLLVGGTP